MIPMTMMMRRGRILAECGTSSVEIPPKRGPRPLPATIPSPLVVPPIKLQGIKTKLVRFIAANIYWDGRGRWIEPFFGSGVVAFNIRPDRVLASDINPYIIRFYEALYQGKIVADDVKEYLLQEGENLRRGGAEYYYFVRDRFNQSGGLLDFLFLNRSGFNGLMRFNQNGAYNVPFCRKVDRFAKAYVTKIVNQVRRVCEVMRSGDWEFRCGDWSDVLNECCEEDFVYLDPPYLGRHTGYYGNWDESDEKSLADAVLRIPAGFALSSWSRNRYRQNESLNHYWGGLIERKFEHFYYVGATENLRNAMIESLLIRPGFESLIAEPPCFL